MKSQRVRFTGGTGHLLSGRLDLPDGEPRGFAVFAHCFTCGMNLKGAINIGKVLAGEGIALLRFDFAGVGESEGDFADTTFASNIADITAAASFLAEEHAAPELLIGHSLGGTAALHAAREIASCKAVAAIAAPADPAHLVHRFREHLAAFERHGEATINVEGRPVLLRRSFVDDLEKGHYSEHLADLRKPVLILHSPLDNTLSIDHAAKLFQMLKHPKSFLSLDNADHLLTREEDARWAGGVILRWAERYCW